MKAILGLVLITTVFSSDGYAQGVFFGSSGSVRTRVGSIDGPIAETNIWGQFLAGASLDSLAPVGLVQPHGNGAIYAGKVTVPDVPPYASAYVQVVAWDSMLWGTVVENVTFDQFGRTDVVQVFLTTGEFPDVIIAPGFTQPAVVPIPEPAVWALAVLGTTGLWLARHRRQ